MIKINIASIVAEYNPLHNGHEFHIKETKRITKSDGVICVMSGNFTQRGTPALLDKWKRAEMALNNGIDLVIELPVIYSSSSAEFFSFGALSLLDKLGVVNYISFGSENDDIDSILKISEVLFQEPPLFKDQLKHYLDSGLSFPAARSKALIHYLVEKDSSDLEKLIISPNNILALEYCKAIKHLKSKIQPVTIKRLGEGYNSLSLKETFSSATAIRSLLEDNNDINQIKSYITENTFYLLEKEIMDGHKLTYSEDMFKYIKYKCNMYPENLIKIPDVTEGLENRIYKSIQISKSLKELIHLVKSKRYTYSRISRILTQFFIGFDLFDVYSLRRKECPYARILGFNDRGKEIIREIQCKGSIPLITRVKEYRDETLSLDIMATKAYSMLRNSSNCLGDYLNSPVHIKNNSN